MCSGTSLVGASPETRRPFALSRESLAGSSEPSDALVGVTSQPGRGSTFTATIPAIFVPGSEDVEVIAEG